MNEKNELLLVRMVYSHLGARGGQVKRRTRSQMLPSFYVIIIIKKSSCQTFKRERTQPCNTAEHATDICTCFVFMINFTLIQKWYKNILFTLSLVRQANREHPRTQIIDRTRHTDIVHSRLRESSKHQKNLYKK